MNEDGIESGNYTDRDLQKDLDKFISEDSQPDNPRKKETICEIQVFPRDISQFNLSPGELIWNIKTEEVAVIVKKDIAFDEFDVYVVKAFFGDKRYIINCSDESWFRAIAVPVY